MTYFPQPNPTQPAPRLKLDDAVPVAIRVAGTISVRGKLHELSATGGLLALAKPLDKGEFVELAFPTNKWHKIHSLLTAQRPKVVTVNTDVDLTLLPKPSGSCSIHELRIAHL
jgi:hypothetical protein